MPPCLPGARAVRRYKRTRHRPGAGDERPAKRRERRASAICPARRENPGRPGTIRRHGPGHHPTAGAHWPGQAELPAGPTAGAGQGVMTARPVAVFQQITGITTITCYAPACCPTPASGDSWMGDRRRRGAVKPPDVAVSPAVRSPAQPAGQYGAPMPIAARSPPGQRGGPLRRTSMARRPRGAAKEAAVADRGRGAGESIPSTPLLTSSAHCGRLVRVWRRVIAWMLRASAVTSSRLRPLPSAALAGHGGGGRRRPLRGLSR